MVSDAQPAGAWDTRAALMVSTPWPSVDTSSIATGTLCASRNRRPDGLPPGSATWTSCSSASVMLVVLHCPVAQAGGTSGELGCEPGCGPRNTATATATPTPSTMTTCATRRKSG